jgi:hypothetical protein
MGVKRFYPCEMVRQRSGRVFVLRFLPVVLVFSNVLVDRLWASPALIMREATILLAMIKARSCFPESSTLRNSSWFTSEARAVGGHGRNSRPCRLLRDRRGQLSAELRSL